jgi:LAGLIDADG endonuclease
MKLFNETIFNPYWVVGFVDGEGCFSVGVFKNKTLRLGYQVQLEFSITQHIRDHNLLLQFIEFFGCGYVSPDGPTKCKYLVRDLSDLNRVIIPFFHSYPLRTVKQLDFNSFVSVTTLMNDKKHLTEQGLLDIQQIKGSMNRNRKYEAPDK